MLKQPISDKSGDTFTKCLYFQVSLRRYWYFIISFYYFIYYYFLCVILNINVFPLLFALFDLKEKYFELNLTVFKHNINGQNGTFKLKYIIMC